jgi:hypothetical protein
VFRLKAPIQKHNHHSIEKKTTREGAARYQPRVECKSKVRFGAVARCGVDCPSVSEQSCQCVGHTLWQLGVHHLQWGCDSRSDKGLDDRCRATALKVQNHLFGRRVVRFLFLQGVHWQEPLSKYFLS